jgi:hypothetical protein
MSLPTWPVTITILLDRETRIHAFSVPSKAWQTVETRIWRNAYFLAEKGPFTELPFGAIDWLCRQAEAELARLSAVR